MKSKLYTALHKMKYESLKPRPTLQVMAGVLCFICPIAHYFPLASYCTESPCMNKMINIQELLGLDMFLRGSHHVDWIPSITTRSQPDGTQKIPIHQMN